MTSLFKRLALRRGRGWLGLLLVGAAGIVTGEPAAATDPLASWRQGVTIQTVGAHRDRHVIHAYFNTCPESPDGRFVLYYTSATADGETGDLRVLERQTGRERVLAAGIVTEDAHRAACQQWCQGGKTVVFHQPRQGRWEVVAVDLASGRSRVLVQDRQLGFGATGSPWVPVYGCHWNPGPHRDLELVHVETGEVRRVVRIRDVVEAQPDWVQRTFGSTDLAVFFPVMSPDARRVFFKVALPSGRDDYRSMSASKREGKVVCDLQEGRLLRLIEKWGHPSWTPDSAAIFEYGNHAIDVLSGRSTRHAPSCVSNHPSVSPDGRLFVTDADVTKRFGRTGEWAIAVGSMSEDAWMVIDRFDNTQGARTWRRNHPHPAFSVDGRRVYYNVNDGPWTSLRVAEAAR